MKKIIFTLSLMLVTATIVFSQNNTPTTFSPTIKLKGNVQSRFDMSMTDSVGVDGKFNAMPVQSNFFLRRVEVRADIALNDHWSGVIRAQLPNLKTTSTGKTIELAYFQYKYKDQLQFRGGQFKMPFELDELTSHEDLRMIERGTTNSLLSSNYWVSYQPGVMVFGTFMGSKSPLSYYAGLFNGSDRSVATDMNSGKEFMARLEYTPIKGIRIGANMGMNKIDSAATGSATGFDLSIQRDLNDNVKLIVEGEYTMASNMNSYISSVDSAKDIANFGMGGYFGQALLRIKSSSKLFSNFEVGGKYESTDPRTDSKQINDSYQTITGGIGFIFLPDNDARLQLNLVHKSYEKPTPGANLDNNMLQMQLQIRI